jgi:membrane protein implicated in regulation of membrane protease activity
MGIDPWLIWMAIGVICVIIEIFTPGFLFLSFGIGAIITGGASLLISSIPAQIAIYAVVTFVLFINLRKLSKKLQANSGAPTNTDALIGKVGVVVKEVSADTRGYVKIGGEEWSALGVDAGALASGTKVKVTRVDGNKVIVTAEIKEDA